MTVYFCDLNDATVVTLEDVIAIKNNYKCNHGTGYNILFGNGCSCFMPFDDFELISIVNI